jgi:pimeloyl-ACP methyl ester carboxylesterase
MAPGCSGAWGLLLVLGGALACDAGRPATVELAPDPLERAPAPPLPPTTPVLHADAEAPSPPVLEAEQAMVDLAVEGFGEAVVSLPLGARGKRPVMIAAHGNFDRPEWQCQVWREIVRDRGFVLCPRGRARPDSPGPSDPRFTYPTNQILEQEVTAALSALRERYPAFVDGGPVLWTGFSLGSIMGVAIAIREPARFERLVLVEGGHDRWTRASVKVFAEGGGKRVLFACGQGGCTGAAKRAAGLLEGAGVATRIVERPGTGHNYVGPLAEEVAAAFDWVVEGDPRWASVEAAPTPR